MGLFDQFKQAMSKDNIRKGLKGGAQSLTDSLKNPQNIQADAAAGNAYGQELRRLEKEGVRGRGVIRAVTDTGEQAVAGTDWKVVDMEIELPGQEPYVASMRQMVPRITADDYQPGKRYPVAVDPTDPNNYALVGPAEA